MIESRWLIKDKGETKKVNKLAKELGVDLIIANMLVQRGIETYDEAESFFCPSLDSLYDPYLMKDMEKAVDRIDQAIKSNEKILIYGDYDVDGTTSVALLYNYLKKFSSKLEYYIPDRFTEGYGVSQQGIDYAEKNSVSLIITIDCGIKAVKQVDYANQKGIDVIICDHHNAGDEIPKAVAVLDPKQEDCKYPYDGLSGCGVGFKLLCAYCSRVGDDLENVLKHLDLVAVSIAADIVPITDENRILAYWGLHRMNSSPCVGLNAIKNNVGFEGKDMQITDVVFKISPRINAAGRIDTGKKAVELLICQDPKEAYKLVEKINEFNVYRKELDSEITEESLKILEDSEIEQEKYTTVLHSDDWNKGVIGIVASRLIEKYYKPTIVFTTSKGLLTGSARSVEGFNIYDAIESCSDLLVNFGGHTAAAGITMKKENFEEFKIRFEKEVASKIAEVSLKPTIGIDSEIKLSDIDAKFYRIIKRFGPFGPGNLSPVFVTRGVKDNGGIRQIGKDGDHLRLNITNGSETNSFIQGVAFYMGAYYEKLKNGEMFDVCYQLDENKFMGQINLQLIIKDIKLV